MRKGLMIVAVGVVLAAALVAALFWSPASRRWSENVHEPQTHQKEPSDEQEGLPPLPDPEMVRATRQEIGIQKSPLYEEKGKKDIWEFISYVTEEGVRVAIRPGLQTDVPLVEMRFKKPAEDGTLKSLKVAGVAWGPWLNVPIERGGANIASWGGTQVNAMAVRVPVLPVGRPESYMKFGQRYAVQFSVGRNKMYESIVRIPDNIPPGKMYVVDVIARYPTSTFEAPRRSRQNRNHVVGRIGGTFPVPRGSLQVQYFNPNNGEMRTTTIEKYGTFRLRAEDLGGMLCIVEQKRVGVGWLYIGSLDKRDLSLPQHADLVVEEEDLVEFDLKVDERHLREDLRGLALRVHKDDPAPMAWAAFDHAHQHLLEDLRKTQTISFRFVPGQWYVVGLYWPRRTGIDQRKKEVIGTVSVTESDEGKTLAVQPLEE